MRNADLAAERHQYRIAGGDRDFRGQSHALAGDGILGGLHQQPLPFVDEVANVRQRLIASQIARLSPGHHAAHVQETRPLQADINKGGLHARNDALHPAKVDVAGVAVATRPGDMQFLQDTVLKQRSPGFKRVDVDQQLFRHPIRSIGPTTGRIQRR